MIISVGTVVFHGIRDIDVLKGRSQANISYSKIIDKLKQVQIETKTTLQPEKNNRRLIRVYGYLVGHEISCIIDTGATDSIISKSIADKLNRAVRKNDTNFIGGWFYGKRKQHHGYGVFASRKIMQNAIFDNGNYGRRRFDRN